MKASSCKYYTHLESSKNSKYGQAEFGIIIEDNWVPTWVKPTRYIATATRSTRFTPSTFKRLLRKNLLRISLD